MEETLFFSLFTSFLKLLFIITSPVIFIVGIFLLYDVDTYIKIEKFLGRTYGFRKKFLIKWLDKNRESLQIFLLNRRRSLGVICLLNSILAMYVILFVLKK